MVFAVYEQGMRIQTPRQALLGRRGIDALKAAHNTRKIADTDSNSSHLEQLAEQPFEQIQQTAHKQRQGGYQGPQPQTEPDKSDSDALKSEASSKKALQAYSSTEQSLSTGQRPKINAGIIMSTPIISAEFDQSLQQGWRLMQQHNVHHLVLVNRKGALMGMVSDKDILKVTSGVGEIALEGRSADDIMLGDLISRKLLTASPDANLLEIAHAMLEQHISALPVVTADDELKGIITRTDLLQAMVNGKLEAWY